MGIFYCYKLCFADLMLKDIFNKSQCLLTLRVSNVHNVKFTSYLGCGGTINLSAGGSEMIDMVGYKTGMRCTWIIKVNRILSLTIILYSTLL